MAGCHWEDGVRIRAAGLLFVLAVVLIYAGGDPSGPSAPPILPAPLLPRGTRWQPLLLSRRRVRVPVITVRWFRSRSSYGGSTTATRQHGRLVCRGLLLLAGDIEMNPGPGSQAVQVAPPESASSLSVYHANVRSLKQLRDLRAFSSAPERHDVVASETWLNDTVATSELELGYDDHTWFRRDRGGVACAVRSSLLPLRLPDPVDTETLLVRLRAVSVTVAATYRPPDDDAAIDRIAAALSAVQPPDCQPSVTLTCPSYSGLRRPATRVVLWPVQCQQTDEPGCQVRRYVRPAWTEAVGVPAPRGDNILDLVLTRHIPARVIVRDGLLSSDHRETISTLSLPARRPPPVVSRRTALNYKRADFDGLRRSLAAIPWGLLDGVGVDEAVNNFYTLLESAIADHVPTVVLRRRIPPWFDGAVRTALRLKEAAFRRLRRNPSPETQADFADKTRI